MINLWYEESYWGYKNGTLSGPEEVVRNTVLALEQENIPYAINEQKYSHNFLVQYQHDVAPLKETGVKKWQILHQQKSVRVNLRNYAYKMQVSP